MRSILRLCFRHGWRSLLAVAIVLSATAAGLWVRDQAWDQTDYIRFTGDINNGFRWGMRANNEGFFSLYEHLGDPQPGENTLDYGPLRLGVMTLWTGGLEKRFPDDPLVRRQPTREYHRPLLMFNTAMELATAFLAGMLVTYIRRWSAAAPTAWTGVWYGIIAGLITWFNPVIICNAHMWPQWDIWPMPFFLGALLCMFKRRWMIAGALVGVGALFKGQLLMVAWTLPLWALLIGDWRGALKLPLAAALAILIVGIPWEFSAYDPAVATRGFELWQRHYSAGAIWLTVGLFICAIAIPLIVRRRFYPWLIALALVIGMASGMLFFNGTDYWLKYGFTVGMWHHAQMYLGPVSNLPALLVGQYGFDRGDLEAVVLTLPAFLTLQNMPDWLTGGDTTVVIGGPISLRTFLLVLFGALCLISTISAATNYFRRDPRVVIGLILPWVVFYAIPLQVHERYLFFGAACCGVFLAAGRAWSLMGLVIIFLGFLPTVHTLLNRGTVPPIGATPNLRFDQFLYAFVDGSQPGIAWALLMALAIALYGLWPQRRSSRPPSSSNLIGPCEELSPT